MLLVPSRWLIAIVLGLVASLGSVQAKDAFVVISGGGGPQNNHYSQYLQARAYVSYLRAHYPENSIWTFFGAGNITGQPPILSDVEQTGLDDKGNETLTWMVGSLPDNHPARSEVLARAFRDEILPTVRDGGTLYLFVGDHGGPSSSVDPESVISLWGLDRDPTLPFGWRSNASSEALGVAELRRWLSAGLGQGRVVFVMSQCFSGGFHYLGLPRELAPNPAWFTRMPLWARAIHEPKNLPLAAGFTATDDHSFASGCTSDVSANHWAGYERYLPENLLGLDLFTLQPGAESAHRSFQEAHMLAVQADQTIDKPRSTSEQYLALWAQTIARIEKEPGLKDSIKQQLLSYHKTLNGQQPHLNDAAFNARQNEFARFIQHMIKENPQLADLAQASEEALQLAIKPTLDGAGEYPVRYTADMAAQMADDDANEGMLNVQISTRLWMKEIIPAWQKALEAGTVKELPASLVAFEQDLILLETSSMPGEAHHVGSRHIQDPKMLLYYHGGYADPATFDPAHAQALVDWSKQRRRAIVDWATQSSEVKLRLAAQVYTLWMPPEILDPDGARGDASKPDNGTSETRKSDGVDSRRQTKAQLENSKSAPLQRSVAAERIYFYRQVLAAWQFLLGVDERSALEHVAALTQLEQTPLPASNLETAKH
jgi:hypothetical protein